jgi:plasmid maintenance system antidote protein VapI
MNTPLYDAADFGRRLSERMAANRQSQRQAAQVIGVSYSTLSRAVNGWPDLSHENWLRLSAWLDAGQERKRA